MRNNNCFVDIFFSFFILLVDMETDVLFFGAVLWIGKLDDNYENWMEKLVYFGKLQQKRLEMNVKLLEIEELC